MVCGDASKLENEPHQWCSIDTSTGSKTDLLGKVNQAVD